MSEMNQSLSDPNKFETYLFTVLRVAIGWLYLWAFLDKTFGLGKTFPDLLDGQGNPVSVGTAKEAAWINGGNPTWGFLTFGTKGKFFESTFAPMADSKLVTFLFMIGLLGIGLTIILGIGRRIGAASGILMMLILYTASIPISTNPIVDSHILESLILAVVGFTDHCGIIFIPQWKKVSDKYPILK